MLALGTVLAVSLFFNFSRANNGQEKYPLLAKRLFIQDPNDLIINFSPLRDQLRTYSSEQPDRIGIYFEYLPTGTSINVNGDQDYFRASLVKLPGVMRAMKLIEEGLLSGTETITITANDINPLFNSGEQLAVGGEYSLGALIERSVTRSDNTAYQAIFSRTNQAIGGTDDDERTIRDVYDYLDIPRSETGETQFISPKNYSSILKSLYFSSYLSYDNSSEILRLLTKSTFDDWLPEPLPNNLPVAHKFGIYSLEQPVAAHVHSDCGIIYLPKRPYILCVMVNSADTATSAGHIRKISEMTYNYLTR